MRIFIPTCEAYYWCLPPCLWLLNRCWPSHPPIVIVGFEPLPWDPAEWCKGVTFVSLGTPGWPAQQWTDQTIAWLKQAQLEGDRQAIMWHEDYWLYRQVDHNAVVMARQYIDPKPFVLRMDLTADRLYSGPLREVQSVAYYDVIESHR